MKNQPKRPEPSDVAFSAVFAGALGSAAVALLFLLVDGIRGDAFYTPSVLGSALFLGASPSEATPVRVEMMALYSVFHLVVFTGVGTLATVLHARRPKATRGFPALAGALLAFLSAGALVADAVLLPGVLRSIGLLPVLLANALAAAVMAWFIHATLQETNARWAGNPTSLGLNQAEGEVL